MCLFATEEKPKTKKTNIKCYKILDKVDHTYKTPWQRILVTDEMLKGEKPLEPDPMETPNFGKRKTGGYIHSMTTLEEAQSFLEVIKFIFSDKIKNPTIFECIIPKNTEYFEGTDSNSYKGYASKKIIFIKEIIEENNRLCNFNYLT